MNVPAADEKKIYKIGGLAALFSVLVAFSEIAITFLPGGNTPTETVYDWFALLQANGFMGIRNLGLLNIFIFTAGIPMYFALYTIHRKEQNASAVLAMILSFSGVAVFLATNRAFAMLDLSGQYARAVTDAQRSTLAAAGLALLSVGRSHSPGTFTGFFLGELSGIMMSAVMLRGKIFSKAAALAGILGFTLLAIFEVSASFIPGLAGIAILVAIGGGLLNTAWLVLVGTRLLQLARASE